MRAAGELAVELVVQPEAVVAAPGPVGGLPAGAGVVDVDERPGAPVDGVATHVAALAGVAVLDRHRAQEVLVAPERDAVVPRLPDVVPVDEDLIVRPVDVQPVRPEELVHKVRDPEVGRPVPREVEVALERYPQVLVERGGEEADVGVRVDDVLQDHVLHRHALQRVPLVAGRSGELAVDARRQGAPMRYFMPSLPMPLRSLMSVSQRTALITVPPGPEPAPLMRTPQGTKYWRSM
mmetsp:Transcript_3657/g.11201  ORF Transcript_3657/g.11201 Transcript_3657/m.11201 type:complete len:236 (+) Transcript_3657:524-1231(+)